MHAAFNFVIHSIIKHMSNLVNEFNEYRTKMNEVILSKENLVMPKGHWM